jgi:hypothetical protein
MDEVEVEYVGGPADGRPGKVPAAAGGEPPLARVVHTSEAWDSWLDPRPAVPAQAHRYTRDPDVPGPPWRYHHRGLIG